MARSDGIGRVALRRALLLALLWWALTGADPSGLAWGAALVLAATAASLAFAGAEGTDWRWGGVARFAGTFVYDSFRGGVDVAVRALSPDLPLDPELIRYPVRVPPGPARNLWMGAMGLMPGTLAVSLDGDELLVHVLVRGDARIWRRLATLERRAARAAGVALEARDG